MSKRSDEELVKLKAVATKIADDFSKVPIDDLYNWIGGKVGELLGHVDAAVSAIEDDNTELRRATRAKLSGLTDRVAELEGNSIRHGAKLDALTDRVARGEGET